MVDAIMLRTFSFFYRFLGCLGFRLWAFRMFRVLVEIQAFGHCSCNCKWC